MYRQLNYIKSKFGHDTFQMSIYIHSYIRFSTMRNAVKISVHTKSVTSLNMIFPIMPSAVNQSFTKSAYKLIHSFHTLIHPYKSKAILNNCILRFETQFLLPLTSKLYIIRLKPVLNWANACSPNILRTVRRTMIRFLIELLVRRTWFGQFGELYFVLNRLVMRCKLRPELAADSMIENVG